ncbi:nucleotide exchange factor GrpE, partial [Enterococcus faecium]|uniref:nucleotide exchange factor GrpE n=3 Tax=Bacteria TaxID=2 RepID=UPI003F42ED88
MTENDAMENAASETETVSEAPAADGAATRIAALEKEVADAKQAVLYAAAEAQNVRRRAEKEAADARAYAVTAFARDLLSV